jgi:hypothetical protein
MMILLLSLDVEGDNGYYVGDDIINIEQLY